MKITYKGESNLISQKISFNPSQKDYEVSAEVAGYLLKTFPNLFEGIIEKEIVKDVIPPVKEEEAKQESKKVKPSSKAK